MTGVHVPACLSLDEHIDAAVRETAGISEELLTFVDRVRADWRDEQMLADEEAVIRYWQAVQADWQMRMGVSQ